MQEPRRDWVSTKKTASVPRLPCLLILPPFPLPE